MAVETKTLSAKAVGVCAFAIYHQLESGEQVSKVVRRDGAGHQADPEAVAELQERGLIEADDNWINLTPEAEKLVGDLIGVMRQRTSA